MRSTNTSWGCAALLKLTLVSLTIFDLQSIDTLQQAEPAKSSIELSRQSYVPRATTPLLDAIGHAVADIDKVELRDGEKVGLVILTDGLENASKEHTKETIRKLLTDRQDNKGWLVTFLGADIDAFAEAGAIGIKGGNYLALKKGKLRESRATPSHRRPATRAPATSTTPRSSTPNAKTPTTTALRKPEPLRGAPCGGAALLSASSARARWMRDISPAPPPAGSGAA